MGFWSSIFAPGEEERSKTLDAELRTINSRDYGPGGNLHTPENWEVVQAHLDNQERDTANIDDDIFAEFEKGLGEGADNIRNKVGTGINTGVGSFLKIIPWQVWVVGAIALLLYLGAGASLLKKAKGVFAK